jgi:hypothetical protein
MCILLLLIEGSINLEPLSEGTYESMILGWHFIKREIEDIFTKINASDH